MYVRKPLVIAKWTKNDSEIEGTERYKTLFKHSNKTHTFYKTF